MGSLDNMTRSLDRTFERLSKAAAGKKNSARKKVKAVAKTVSRVAKAVKVAVPAATTSASGKRTIKLGIERDNDYMYFIKNGAVWRVPRKRPGKPKGKKEIVKKFAGKDELDYSNYLYYIDGKGDVIASPRKKGRK